MQIPTKVIVYGVSFSLLLTCLATIGVCIFYASASVGAFFIFIKEKEKEK